MFGRIYLQNTVYCKCKKSATNNISNNISPLLFSQHVFSI